MGVLYFVWFRPASWKTYYVEVWVRAECVDANSGKPVAEREVRTIPNESVAREAWVQEMRELTGTSHSPEATVVTTWGRTDAQGQILLKVKVSSGSRNLEPFQGVHYVWISGVGFVDTRDIGSWKETGGRDPFAVLDLGVVRVQTGE